MPKTIALQILRKNLSRVLSEVASGGQSYIVETNGRPTAVLLSLDEYHRLQAAQETRTQPPAKTVTLGREGAPARVISPHLAHPAQARDFELEVIEDSPHA